MSGGGCRLKTKERSKIEWLEQDVEELKSKLKIVYEILESHVSEEDRMHEDIKERLGQT